VSKEDIKSFSNKKNISKKQFISLSRDYYIYATFILLVAILSSLWFATKSYNSQTISLENKLIDQSKAIDTQLNNYFNYVSHIGEDKGHKIAQKNADLNHIAHLFKRNFFFPVTRDGLRQKAFIWPHFSWIDKNGNIVVRSEYGILKKPQKAKDNIALYQSTIDSWRLHLSKPYYDKFSEKTFINGYLGVFNIDSEKYLGSISTRFDIKRLVELIELDLDENAQFLVLNEDLEVIINSNNKIGSDDKLFVEQLSDIDPDNQFFVLDKPLKYNNNSYKIYRKSAKHPFIILTGYNYKIVSKKFLTSLLYKAIEVFGAAFVILIILFFQRRRIIKPVSYLSQAIHKIANGQKDVKIDKSIVDNEQKHSLEINELYKGILLTKKLLEQERENKKIAQENNIKLKELNDKLEHQNNLAKKSKKSREKFLSQSRQDIIENAIMKMTQDLASIINHDEGNVIMTKQAIANLHKRMLDRCAKILSYVNDNLNLSNVDIKKIMQEAIDISSYDTSINNVKLTLDISNKISDIYVDERSIKHVIIALINYAMDDRRRGANDSFIKISVKKLKKNKQDYLQIIFEDNGHGISQEMRNNFSKNIQKEGKKEDNISLNLHSIRYILTLHNADLNIENQTGKGSVMTLQMPYKKIDEEKGDDNVVIPNSKKEKKINKIDNIIELFPRKK
jgi:signal transduction histidine kinase